MSLPPTLLAKAVTNLPRFKEKGHRPALTNRRNVKVFATLFRKHNSSSGPLRSGLEVREKETSILFKPLFLWLSVTHSQLNPVWTDTCVCRHSQYVVCLQSTRYRGEIISKSHRIRNTPLLTLTHSTRQVRCLSYPRLSSHYILPCHSTHHDLLSLPIYLSLSALPCSSLVHLSLSTVCRTTMNIWAGSYYFTDRRGHFGMLGTGGWLESSETG